MADEENYWAKVSLLIKDGVIESKKKYFNIPENNKKEVKNFDNQSNTQSGFTFKDNKIKKLIDDTLPGVQTDDKGKLVLRALGKVFVEQLIEETRAKAEENKDDKLTVEHVKEAYRKMNKQNVTLNNQPLKNIFK